jgi:hypothetical protein
MAFEALQAGSERISQGETDVETAFAVDSIIDDESEAVVSLFGNATGDEDSSVQSGSCSRSYGETSSCVTDGFDSLAYYRRLAKNHLPSSNPNHTSNFSSGRLQAFLSQQKKAADDLLAAGQGIKKESSETKSSGEQSRRSDDDNQDEGFGRETKNE